ncbi:VIT1/CCC1 transporter family protein [Kiritimatiella glycovorans]|uniref:Rubrerythrin diiron-binding domain-containing protein n=1 Tax=Kiritimatiella glycovorans TaxID=1307763 RepID=A0A0G3EH26_9BACT|nr:VIT1/CCC1 transporter family protein [Kiritimatiella glycovorans]AKJ64110.1 hypothetical protein L21SP4_00847 [Kiritimatiella glycovorans]
MQTTTDPSTRALLLKFQRNEITEYHIYQSLAELPSASENAEVLRRIADDEKEHYELWKNYTGEDVEPDRKRVLFYTWISRVFGLTFGIKLMERNEDDAQDHYEELAGKIRDAERVFHDEEGHEEKLLRMIDEERLRYIRSVVLGLNDALVELTGALAGLSFALRNTELIALSGSITGFAAALSMAASEYLSAKAERQDRRPVKAALYTGTAYFITVALLILPYLVFGHYGVCLAFVLAEALGIIALFNYYLSVANDEPFRARFTEMSLLSLGVAAVSFLVGIAIRAGLGVET